MTHCYSQTKSFFVLLEQLGEQNLIDTYVTSWRLTSLPVAIQLSTKFHRQPNSTMNASLKFPILIRILKPPAGAVMCRLRQAWTSSIVKHLLILADTWWILIKNKCYHLVTTVTLSLPTAKYLLPDL